MKIYPIRYTKALLDAAPEKERLLFLFACQVANDIGMLSKGVVFARNYQDGVPVPVRHGQIALVTLNIKLLAGRAYEGWTALIGPHGLTYREYKANFDDETIGSAKALGREFADDFHSRLRNKVGSHFDVDLLREGYDAIPADEELVDYLADARGNSLYYATELVTVMGMVGLTGLPLKEGLEAVIDRVTEASGRLNDLLQDIIMEFSIRHLGITKQQLLAAELDLETARMSDVTTPFFTEAPGEDELEAMTGSLD